MNPNYLDRKRAAEYLGLSEHTLARWAVTRMGPPFSKVGSRTRYKIADLDAFLEANTIQPVASSRR
jgi:excisionase family DNA binding protein